MNKAIRFPLAMAAIALGSLCAVQGASANTDVYLSVGVPVRPAPVYVQGPQAIYVPPPQVVNPAAPTVYVTPGYGFGSPWEQQRAWQEAQWRQQQWRREREWREHEWREHEWREHEWREEHREHEWREHRHEGDDD